MSLTPTLTGWKEGERIFTGKSLWVFHGDVYIQGQFVSLSMASSPHPTILGLSPTTHLGCAQGKQTPSLSVGLSPECLERWDYCLSNHKCSV